MNLRKLRATIDPFAVRPSPCVWHFRDADTRHRVVPHRVSERHKIVTKLCWTAE